MEPSPGTSGNGAVKRSKGGSGAERMKTWSEMGEAGPIIAESAGAGQGWQWAEGLVFGVPSLTEVNIRPNS